MKTDPYSALDKPQKHTLRGRTSGRSYTLSAPPGLSYLYSIHDKSLHSKAHRCLLNSFLNFLDEVSQWCLPKFSYFYPPIHFLCEKKCLRTGKFPMLLNISSGRI